LKENSDIRLEVVLHPIEERITGDTIKILEKWSQELSSYFINKEIDMDAFHNKIIGWSYSVFKPFVPNHKTIDGLIEFIFMKN
jgi:hypothetical protein